MKRNGTPEHDYSPPHPLLNVLSLLHTNYTPFSVLGNKVEVKSQKSRAMTRDITGISKVHLEEKGLISVINLKPLSQFNKDKIPIA